jgi:predicted ATPase
MAHVRHDNLPGEVTSFVGRTEELAGIKQLLGQFRLVTLTGIGGVGKTRLAVRVAWDVKPNFADGVWLAELSPLQDPDLLPHTIAAAIGVEDQTARPMMDVLAGFLADKQMLLVLDTCEHQVGACAEFADRLLPTAPGLRLLATSRVRLGVADEHPFPVDPLPTHARLPADNPAAALFLDRAAAVTPKVAIGPDVVELCQRLDGIPLALELAAVRLREFSVTGLMERMSDRFELLEGASRAAVPRHQTMRTAIGWSHELCRPLERLLWARLSVFAGSFELTAAQAVCGDSKLNRDEIAELLTGLAEKSIVVREGSRYRLLDTLREYGAEWLSALGEEMDFKRRHRDHYEGVSRVFDALWWGPDQLEMQQRLRQDRANIRLAIEFCYSLPEEHLAGLELAGLLIWYWLSCGAMKEGRRYLERGLTLCPAESPVRTRALWSCAWLAGLQGEPDVTERYAAECRAAAERQADDFSMAWGVAMGSVLGVVRGDSEMAVRMAREAMGRFEELPGAGIGGPYMQLALGVGLLDGGDHQQALAVLDAVRARCVEHGDLWARSYAELFRGMTELAIGDVKEAARSARAAGRVKWSLQDRLGTAEAVDLLAEAVCAGGEAEHAARLLGIAETLWRTIGIPQADIPVLTKPRRACEESARTMIGGGAYEAAYEEGRALDLETGVAYAITE